MGLAIQRVGAFVIGLTAFFAGACVRSENNNLSKSKETENTPVQDITQETSGISHLVKDIPTTEEIKEEIRRWAIRNRYELTAQFVVSDPTKYKVDENDIDFVIGKKMILQDPRTGNLEFVEDNEQNLRTAQNEKKHVVRRDNSSWFNLGIGKNPRTTELIKSNENLRKRVQGFLINNLGEAFCVGLAMNINDYPVNNEIIDVCTKNKERLATFYFARKKAFIVNDAHRQIVRNEYMMPLARGVVRNPGYIQEGLTDVPQEDKKVCREHPKSDVAAVLSMLDIYQFEEADMEAAIATTMGLDDIIVEEQIVESYVSSYAANIVKKLNRLVTTKEIEAVRNSPNSDFAQVVANKFYLEGRKPEDIEKDIEFAIKLAEEAYNKDKTHASPTFSEELFANPALPLTEKIVKLATSEPYCYMGISEAITEREDFPVTEEALKLANEKPYISFSVGLKTNIAIKELRKVVAEVSEIIQNEKDETNVIKLVKDLIESVDKMVEEAKGEASPGKRIREIKDYFETIKSKLNTSEIKN